MKNGQDKYEKKRKTLNMSRDSNLDISFGFASVQYEEEQRRKHLEDGG